MSPGIYVKQLKEITGGKTTCSHVWKDIITNYGKDAQCQKCGAQR